MNKLALGGIALIILALLFKTRTWAGFKAIKDMAKDKNWFWNSNNN